MAKFTESAHERLTKWMQQYGLGNLANWAWSRYKNLGGGQEAFTQVTDVELYDQPAFQRRFPAYKPLAEKGQAMSVGEMISYEKSARDVFHAAGIPAGFWDTPDDFASFMVNNVSPAELQARVQLRQQAALETAPDVRNQLRTMYGIDDGALTAYFIDPKKALPILQQQFTAATIGATAGRVGAFSVDRAQAEHLAQIGVDENAAAQGFGQLGEEQGLFQQQVIGEDAIDLDTQLAATFENQAAARLRIKKRQESRTAAFKGNAGFGIGQGGVTGLGQEDQSAS